MKNFSFKSIPISVLTLALFLFSCSKDDSPDPVETEPFSFEAIEDIANFQGELESEVVVVYVQGGPSLTLDDQDVRDIVRITNTSDILTINVHQAQTRDPSLISSGDISIEEAMNINQESITNLKTVIAHLKNSGKRVNLLGTSFGGFLVQALIAQEGIDIADAYLILASRMDIQEGFWMGFSDGQTGGFVGGTDWSLTEQTEPLDRNISRLAAGVGRIRYTEAFANFSSMGKLTFYSANQDERVGRLTDAEAQFLISKGANLIQLEGAHADALAEGILKGYEEGFNL